MRSGCTVYMTESAKVRIYDYADLNVPMLARMFDRRSRGNEVVGYSISHPASAAKLRPLGLIITMVIFLYATRPIKGHSPRTNLGPIGSTSKARDRPRVHSR